MKWLIRNKVELILGTGLSLFLINFFTEQDADLYITSIPLVVLGSIMLYQRHFRISSFTNFSGFMHEDDDDDLYEEAKRIVLEEGKASTSFLQRRLRIGYSRSARLIDMLEENEVIGQADGVKPREVKNDT